MIEQQESLKNIKSEIKRKLVHLVALAVPIGYTLLPKKIALFWMMFAAVIGIGFDILKVENKTFRNLIFRFFRDMFRNNEVHLFTGSSFLLFSSVICMVIYNKWVAIIALTYIIVGDTAAAIFGRLYGKHKVYGKRSIEGSIAFVIVAAGVTSAMFFVPYDIIPIYYRILGAVLAACIELVIPQVDDNLTVPILSGLMLQFSLLNNLQ